MGWVDGSEGVQGCLVRRLKLPNQSQAGENSTALGLGLGQVSGLSQIQGCAVKACRYSQDHVNNFLGGVNPFLI